MGQSTGIVLTATAISFGNEWLQTGEINWRIPVAGVATALLFDALETVEPKIATGLAIIMLITAVATPFNGKSPAQTAAGLVNDGSKLSERVKRNG